METNGTSGTAESGMVRGFVLGVILVVGVWLAASRTHLARPLPRIDTRLESGDHLVMVVLGPTSGPAAHLRDAVVSIRDSLRERARVAGHHFSTVGVSDHWSIDQGSRILATMGPFDEVIVGRNWLNTGIHLYIDGLGGGPMVPQVAVFRQSVTLGVPLTRSEPEVLVQLRGTRQIVDWAQGGSRLTIRE